jgi:pimeloyl-ACP methyl ester carboxylesterase
MSPPPSISQTYHVEVGYDSLGQLVVTLWPTGSSALASDSGQIAFIRLSGGNVTVFDQTGAPVSYVPPVANVPAFNPLNLLGTNPGASVLSQLVVSSPSAQATRTNSQLSYSNSEAIISGSFSSGGSPGTTQWNYAQSGSQWVTTSATFAVSKPGVSTTRTLQFANVQWNDNTTNDTNRANQGSTAVNPPPTTSSTPSAITTTSSSGCPPKSANLGGSQNVVFQHGLFSSGCTWSRMVPWLNQKFRFGVELVPSLNSFDNLTNQGNALVSDISSAGGSSYLLIGHSQGGLISRYAGQHFQNLNQVPPIVSGVVTLDTPHQGAPLAALAQGAVQSVFGGDLINIYDDVGCGSPYDNILCYLVALQYSGITQQLVNIGSLTDLVPGSTFLNNLNAQPETFQKAAVIANTDRRWIETRIADEFILKGCNPEDFCGERNVAAIYGIIYDSVQISWDISEFVCIITQDPTACAVADYLLPIWVDMDVADLDYNFLAAEGNPEDGIVPSSSQNYPSSSALQYPISHADSHTGATRSDRARDALEQVLASAPFFVPTQASCTFSVSPPAFSVSSAATASSFTVTTGAGCQWSAVSNAPWLSITSGSSGTSSGSVSFSVAINSTTLPRNGTITISSGTSAGGSVFTVQQAGQCTYFLSVSTVSLPPGGGSVSATVYTQSGCVWSAVPNAPWITITNGTGTGGGSFTVTAASNSANTDLLGTVTVMNQTLTVLLGSPAGMPGTGSIAVNGFPHSKYVAPPGCHAKSCATLIYESGEVRVTVAGDTYSASYAGTTGATQIAAALANAMNAGSLVSATVFETTISVTSKVNGSLTNYSIATSYSYDTGNFTSPAFTASASGSRLTGGTD